MKTVEELKGMTQEDLVRLVQELQEENQKLSKERKSWLDECITRNGKIDTLTSVVKQISSLL